ncbi:MAG: glycoside hydrolase family 125 protein [Eubacteriales bacterium]|nr:glycoside hydrolase family 125 protein [Eubacteriales bacterium]
MAYQVTGNEYLSLPTIRETDGAIEGVTFLTMLHKGLLELRGDDGLIRPYFEADGSPQAITPRWERAHCWLPSFQTRQANVNLTCTYLTPVGERGFAIRLEVSNTGAQAVTVRFGLQGRWDRTLHEINESVELPEGREVIRSDWNKMFVWRQAPGTPLFAFAPCIGDYQPFSVVDQGAEWAQEGFGYHIDKEVTLAPGESGKLDVFFGVGYESVSATASAKDLLRQGYDALYQRTVGWLSAREKKLDDPTLETLLNTNLFFTFFYASGRCVDTEELCLVTSRSPRYYVSAAYWDRDSLLWAFPAILLSDAAYAREILDYVFTRQARNFGVHSRYIDGTVLEPGFELDELCAPVIALERYIAATGDIAYVQETLVRNALERILRTLESKKHPSTALYETFLQPTDDKNNHPYLTYDNALVCRVFRALAKLLNKPELRSRAEAVREAIYAHCVREKDGKRFFAWSVDLLGAYDIYDEPPGSLQLLPFYGFCDESAEVWQNTVAMIRNRNYSLSFADAPIAEIGCLHAPHPWVLSLCNSLLSGHGDTALAHLRLTRMDNGLACESVNEHTGVCETGEAFATCAGFLAYALYRYCSENRPFANQADETTIAD